MLFKDKTEEAKSKEKQTIEKRTRFKKEIIEEVEIVKDILIKEKKEGKINTDSKITFSRLVNIAVVDYLENLNSLPEEEVFEKIEHDLIKNYGGY